MLTLTVARHGETSSNAGNIIHTGDGGELTERGISMARALGEHLKDEVFTRIYSSDYKRARDTTENIVSQLGNRVPVVTLEPLLRERDIGDWERKDMQLLFDRLAELGRPEYRIHTVEGPGGESYEHCKYRAAEFFKQLCRLADEAVDDEKENILVVTHSWWISCFFDYLAGSSSFHELVNASKESFDQSPQNTCTTKFSVGKKDEAGRRKLTFSQIYDTTHYKNMH
jgi:broad specificity phosphatase PhoE